MKPIQESRVGESYFAWSIFKFGTRFYVWRLPMYLTRPEYAVRHEFCLFAKAAKSDMEHCITLFI